MPRPLPLTLLVITALSGLLLTALWLAGYRLNTSTSYPPGLYQLQTHQPPALGALVLFCPPDNAAMAMAKDRHYIRFGPCPGGFSPAIKRIYGQQGDRIGLAGTVTINGIPVPGAALLTADSDGRPLPRLAGFTVPGDHVFLLSDHQPRTSFDSRYYGPVSTANLIGVIRPVWLGLAITATRFQREWTMFDIAPFEHCIDSVHPSTVQHIIQVESSSRPYAINVNKLPGQNPPRFRQPTTKAAAIKLASYYLSLGHSVDVGLMQVNSNNFGSYGVTLSDMFEPCQNIAVGSKILREAYTRAIRRYPEPQVALRHALSAYNTGHFTRGFRNGYVYKYPPLVDTQDNKAIYAAETRVPLGNLYD